MVIAFGSELRGKDIEKLVSFVATLTGAKLICLGDYANSRGASEMGRYPDLLPGYEPVTSADKFQQEWGKLPTEKGLSLPEMAGSGDEELKAQLEALKAKEARSGSMSFKVSDKGGVSVYGLGRFPVTLYYEQWIKLLDRAQDLREFLEENKSKLKLKE